MRAIIIDDEVKAIKALLALIENYCPKISIVGSAINALDAVTLVLHEKPELVFLDITMPGHDGFEILEKIKQPNLKVIFTTAHKDYAIKAIRHGAIDYLLKPIDPDDLTNCIHRLLEGQKNDDAKGVIQINVKEGVLFIKPNEIVKLKASGSYTEIYLANGKKLTTSKLLREYEKILDANQFYRCHNSYLINLQKVEKLLNEDGFFAVFDDGSRAEVARKSKDELLQKMKAV